MCVCCAFGDTLVMHLCSVCAADRERLNSWSLHFEITNSMFGNWLGTCKEAIVMAHAGGDGFTNTSLPHHHSAYFGPDCELYGIFVWCMSTSGVLHDSFMVTSQALHTWLKTNTWIGSRWEALGANVKKPHTGHIHFPTDSQQVPNHQLWSGWEVSRKRLYFTTTS